MWKKKIKQKKMQFILIAIILMLSSSIFTICTSFTSTASKYIEDYYNGKNIKDIIVQTYDDNIVSNLLYRLQYTTLLYEYKNMVQLLINKNPLRKRSIAPISRLF